MEAKVQGTPTFKLVKWNVVASWASDGVQASCDICKSQIDSVCIHCVAKNDPNIVCYIEEGTCRHAFHQHCLQAWYESSKSYLCLMCKTTWNAVKTRQVRKQG